LALQAPDEAIVIVYSNNNYTRVENNFLNEVYIREYLRFLEESDEAYSGKYLIGIYISNNRLTKNILLRFKR